MKRLLFIGHEASRSGAPIVLLQLLTWLRKRSPDMQIDVLLLGGGDLTDEFRDFANVTVLSPEQNTTMRMLFNYARKKLDLRTQFKPRRSAVFFTEYDLIIGNTVATLEYLKFFKTKGFRTVCWIHEMEYAVTTFYTRKEFLELSAHIDRFIAGSNAVSRFLVDSGITSKIDVVYDFLQITEKVAEDRNALFGEIGIPPDSFVVGGCGTVEWRKGVDLFLQIAAATLKIRKDFFFLWVGGARNVQDGDYRNICFDLARLGIDERVKFTGHQPDIDRFFAAMDVFALTSREDPFPLVCLKAASLGKPVLCFDRAGGMPEFVESDAGSIVPYGDLNAFRDALIHYRDDPNETERAGRAAKEKLDEKFSLERSCGEISSILLKS